MQRVFILPGPVQDGIFHQRLDGQHRDHHLPAGGNVPHLEGKARPQPLALQGQILPGALHLLRQCADGVLVVVRPPQQIRQIADEIRRLGRSLPISRPHQQIQGVKQKVRTDLGLQKLKFTGVQRPLQCQLLLHLTGVFPPGLQLRLGGGYIPGKDLQHLHSGIQLFRREHPQRPRQGHHFVVIQLQLLTVPAQCAVKRLLGIPCEELPVCQAEPSGLRQRHRHGDHADAHVTLGHRTPLLGVQPEAVVAGQTVLSALFAADDPAAEAGKHVQPQRPLIVSLLIDKGHALPRHIGKCAVHLL